MPPAIATTYVNAESYARLVTPEATPWLLAALVGAVALLGLGGERHSRLRGCQALGSAVLVFAVLQLLAGQVGRGLLFHRMLLILGVTLLAGAVLAAAEHGPELAARVRQASPRVQWRRLGAALLAVGLFVGLSGHAREWMDRDGVLRQRAHDMAAPDGRLSPLASDSAREDVAGEPPVTELADAVTQVSREAGQDAPGAVLTDQRQLLVTTPLFAYLQWWEVYSNPLGEYPRRQAFVEGLAEGDPEDVVRALRSSADGPTVFVLRVDGDDVTYGSAAYDPTVPRSLEWSVRIPTETFESRDFVSRQVGDWLVAALRTP
jgi:galactan 5-O-arabinofuranosyltransferase